jgi:hypothetical protein
MILPLDKDDIAAIKKIKDLPDTSVQQLLAALRSEPIVADCEETAKKIAPKVPSVRPSDLTNILEGLSTLYRIREIAGVMPSKFLSDLMNDVRNMRGAGWHLSEESLRAIRERFNNLLNVEPFTIVSKAAGLQREGDRLYCDSRILSDLRPVFGKEVGRPVGAVITHTLRLGYHEGTEIDHKQLYVVLDSDDLESLIYTLNRAQAKDKALRELLAKAKLPDLTF